MPGTKLKIPFMSKEVIDSLEETESFISDYYPKFDGKVVEGKKKEEEIVVIKEEEIRAEEKIEITPEISKVNEEKKPEVSDNTTKHYPRFQTNYFGNVPPNISQAFIKKI